MRQTAIPQKADLFATPTWAHHFSAIHLAHQIDLEITLGQEPFELGILQFERLQPLHVSGRQAGEVLAPDVDGLLTDLVLFGGFCD